MKTENYTCDICDFKTNREDQMNDACIMVAGKFSTWFHVCTTCYQPERKKSVFKILFNKFIRALRT